MFYVSIGTTLLINLEVDFLRAEENIKFREVYEIYI